MQRLAVKIPLPSEARQIANHLIDSEGTCRCGRVLRKLDAKLVLMTAVPSQSTLLAAAYCIMCSRTINQTLFNLSQAVYTGAETAPIDQRIKTTG